ncbi:MAG TPA: ComF family protein [Microbacteriaceae bacterium]|nr:ComF family protein [Microbacteriaceae bacterium]
MATWWREACDLLLPVSCAGCGASGGSLCTSCLRAMTPRVVRADLDAGLPVWAAGRYEGTLRRVILAYKDGGRTDCGPALAGLLRAALRAALTQVPAGEVVARQGIRLTTVPSTRAAWRRRGYRPVPRLASHAGLKPAQILRPLRQSVDQAALDRAAREENRSGSLAARRVPAGSAWLLIDDIVTTGATTREVARAIGAAGGGLLGVVALAYTPRRVADARDTPPVGEGGRGAWPALP